MKKIIVLTSIVLLSGCGDSNEIQQVKDMVTYSDNTITIGNAFEHRSMCLEVKWEKIKDTRERNIVRYTCMINPIDVNQYITKKIDPIEKNIIQFIDNQALSFNEKNRENQITLFYLSNGEKALKALSESELLGKYNTLKKELSDYLNANYQTENIRQFKFYDDFGLKKSTLFVIEPQNEGGYRVSDLSINDLLQDPYISEKINQITIVQQEVIHLFSANNSEIDINDDKGFECGYRDTFPCLPKKIIRSAFDNILLKQIPYSLATAEFKEKMIEYQQTRVPMDKRDKNFENLKGSIHQRIEQTIHPFQVQQVKQFVDFSLIKNQPPALSDCHFILIHNDGSETEITNSNCFDMAYSSEWNNQYSKMINDFYSKYIHPEMKKLAKDIDREEISIRSLD